MASGVFLALSIGEIYLRAAGTFATYPEKVAGKWKSSFIARSYGNSWFHTWTPNAEITLPRAEFSYTKKTNSLGLKDMEFDTSKPKNQFRIIGIGDSYTEGVGTPSDSTWLKEMERSLNAHPGFSNVLTYNAGCSGSDPWFGYILLKEKLIRYKPDLVILAVNNSDYDDHYIRGGMERFRPDTSIQFRDTPWEEVIYRRSHLFRLYNHKIRKADYLYRTQEDIERSQQAFLKALKDVLFDFQTLARSNGFELLVVFHPTIWDLANKSFLFTPLIDELKVPPIQVIDLLEYFLTSDEITPSNFQSFYWPKDQHHNSSGYRIFGQGVAEGIIEKYGMNK